MEGAVRVRRFLIPLYRYKQTLQDYCIPKLVEENDEDLAVLEVHTNIKDSSTTVEVASSTVRVEEGTEVTNTTSAIE